MHEYQAKELTSMHTPACPPPCVHRLVNLLVNPVRLLIVGFVCCSRKETKLVVWILELFWIYVRLFTATRLRLPVLLSGHSKQPHMTLPTL